MTGRYTKFTVSENAGYMVLWCAGMRATFGLKFYL